MARISLFDRVYGFFRFLERSFHQTKLQLEITMLLAVVYAIDGLLLTVGNQIFRWFRAPFTFFKQTVLPALGIDVGESDQGVVPPRFAPSEPPPFLSWPFSYIICRLVSLWDRITGFDSEREKSREEHFGTPKNYWIRDWAYWHGIGHNGKWGVSAPPDDAASRSPCPALNALASQGVFPHSGRKMTASKLVTGIARAYNLAPTIAFQLYSPLYPVFADKGHVFDLEDIGIANIIEHDASILRPDLHVAGQAGDLKTMSRPHPEMFNRYLMSSGKEKLNELDFANILTERRAESKRTNSQYSNTLLQHLFGSGNCALMYQIYGGQVEALRCLAGAPEKDSNEVKTDQQGRQDNYERIPSGENISKAIRERRLAGARYGWQPAAMDRAFGITIFEALFKTLEIEMLARE